MKLVPLCSVELDIGERFEVGQTAFGGRLIGEITGARWKGDEFTAEMVGAAAADWAVQGEGGLLLADVRMTLRTNDGALVYVSYTGLMDGAAEGAPIRSAMRFETGAERYQWLTRTFCLGDGRFDEDRNMVTYEVFLLK